MRSVGVRAVAQHPLLGDVMGLRRYESRLEPLTGQPSRAGIATDFRDSRMSSISRQVTRARYLAQASASKRYEPVEEWTQSFLTRHGQLGSGGARLQRVQMADTQNHSTPVATDER